MEKSVLPIVFAANDNYSVFCYTAIYSLIQHAGNNYVYQIYVFQTDISEENRRMLESLSAGDVKVQCVDISRFTSNVCLKESLHLSIETYYRLFIPLILPQYQKVLYLDSDLCILADVVGLYECDLKGCAVGAVPDVQCYILEKHAKEDLGGLDCRKTFNAGVLVMDTVRFEEDRIRDKCLALLEEDYQRERRKLVFADQDALNIALYGNYCVLDKRWNYQTQYLWREEELFPETRKEYMEMPEKAFVIHFAGDKKPWKYPDLPQANVFWDQAKDTTIFRNIISNVMADVRACEGKVKCFDGFQFPYRSVPFQSKVVIYAAGMVGKAFYEQMKVSKYADVVLWVDRNWEAMDAELGVKAVERIQESSYDFVVIAIDSEITANVVKQFLIEMNVPEEKIVWEEYWKNQNRG